MKIEYILIACDNNPMFLSFLPSVSYHWKSMGYKVAFGLVTDTDISETMETNIRSMVDDLYVHRFDADTCPFARIVMGKLFRFYLSRYYPANTVCIQDIDYYVFDKHAHIESRIVDPANEVLTHGFNAYYSPVEPAPPVSNPWYPWLLRGTFPYVQGLELGALVFDRSGNVGIPAMPPAIPNERVLVLHELRFPATPMVGHGALVYKIFSSDPSQSFDEFLTQLSERQKTFAPASGNGGQSTFDHPEFSDETLMVQLNRTNGVKYRHTVRPDFQGGIAQKRIDPRRSSYEQNWIPNPSGTSFFDLMASGHVVDIQPVRPFQRSRIMDDVFSVLNIPHSLQDIDAALYGTERD